MDYESIKKTVDAGQYANLTQGQKDVYNKANAPTPATSVGSTYTPPSAPANMSVGYADQQKAAAAAAPTTSPTAPTGEVLTPAQVSEYYKTQTPLAAPLSPLDWLSRQKGSTSATPTVSPTSGAMTGATTPGTTPSTTPGMESGAIQTPYYSRATGEAITQPKVETEEEIADRKRKAAQAEIDALNKYYDTLLAQQAEANKKAARSTSSISVLTGLAGSTEAGVAAGETEARSQRANQAIQNERNVAIQSILSKVRSEATTEARQARLDAAQSQKDAIEIRTAMQQEALTNLQNLAAGGVTFDGLKAGDPESFKALADQFGGETALKGAFTLNIPQEQILDKRVEGGKYVIAYKNPTTGKVRIESVDLGIPNGYSKSVDLGNQVMFVPDNFDPNNKSGPQPYYVPKGLTPSQAAEGATGTLSPEKTVTQLELLKGAIQRAEDLSNASGRSEGRRKVESWLVGSTDYTNLVAETNTLRTNVLTLMTDPTIKKFFGPQMSNADVQLMTSAGTTLNPELQSPENMKKELTRLKDLISRIDTAVASGVTTGGTTSGAESLRAKYNY